MPGRYACQYRFDAIRGGSTPTGSEWTTWSGSCSDAGSTFDSVYLEISPPSENVLTSPISNIPFRITSDGINEVFSFNPSALERTLDVYDALGRIAFSLSIQPSETEHKVQLNKFASGCYFGSLGDQRTKFIVPSE